MPPVALPDDELAAVFGPVRAAGATAERIYDPIASASAGIWRVTCAGRTAVLKVLAHDPHHEGNWPSSEDVGHWYYWRREADVYASGLLDGVPGGVRPPACLALRERGDGTIALWLEDVDGEPGTRWSLDRYATASRHFGHTQASFARGPLPDHRWLSRGWMRAYVDARAHIVAALDDPAVWDDVAVTTVLDAPTVAALRALRDDNPRFLRALDALPRTVCHLDLHPANVFATGTTTTVIDWAFTGIGAIAEDPGNLVPDAVFDFHVAPADLDALFAAVADGYTAGLTDGGWAARDVDVRGAMALAMAAKYVWIGPNIGRSLHVGREKLNGRAIAEALDAWVPTLEFVLARAADAKRAFNLG